MLSLVLPIALSLVAQAPFALRDGDRVLFYGDSITDNSYYPQFVENYVVTRYPNLRVTFVNYGWSGDRVGGGGGGPIARRLERDVFPFRPTMVTIMLGMNDASYRTFDQGIFDTFRTGYEHILDELKSHGDPRVTIILPSPYDDVTQAPRIAEGGYNAVLRKYGDYLATLAMKRRSSLADFNAPVVDMLGKANALDAESARRLIPDRVHPTGAAHIVMGAALLKAWGAPAMVSSVEIDGAAGKVINAQNATVQVSAPKAGVIEWRQLESGLPLYFDRESAMVSLVLKSSSVLFDLDQEILKVKGLGEGTYRLAIDGEEVGRFYQDQWASGVNLAEFSTPMTKQAAAVAQWTGRRQFLRQTMWRNIVVATEGLGLAERDAAVRGLEKLETEIVARQHLAAKPAWHIFRLEPAP